MLQVGSYKLRNGKRIFKMAPIHHHFELKGWPETKVVARLDNLNSVVFNRYDCYKGAIMSKFYFNGSKISSVLIVGYG